MSETSVTIAIIVFVITYTGMATGSIRWLKLDRAGIAVVGAFTLIISETITLKDAVGSIDFSTILTLFGLMILSAQMRAAGFYAWFAKGLTRHLEKPQRFLFVLMGASAFLSALLINDVVCLAFTPIVCAALLRHGLNPVPFLVGLAISSNIGSAATTIGNPQNILIAQKAELGFGAFLLWCIVPVVISLAIAAVMVWMLGRNHLELKVKPKIQEVEAQPLHRWMAAKGVIVLILMIVLFLLPVPHELGALFAAAAILVSHRLKSAGSFKEVDWSLLLLFCGLFVVVGAFTKTGLPGEGVSLLQGHGVEFSNLYVLSGVAAVLSHIISNVPAIMLILELQPVDSPQMGYALALASTFAGNFILVGSIANLIVVEQAKRFGVSISFGEYFRYGAPVAMVSFIVLFGWLALNA